MESYEDVCTVPLVETYGGTEYTFAKLALDEMAIAAAHVRKVRLAAVTEALNGVMMDSETRSATYAKVTCETIYTGTLLDDAEGRIMLIWLSLTKAGGTHKIATLRKAFPALPFKRILDLMIWITGEQREKKSADPTVISEPASTPSVSD